MRAAPIPHRFAWAALFALLLSVRSLAPAGFMPAFEHGTATIVICPDADGVSAAMISHHHDPADPKGAHHQPCPYAASVGPTVGGKSASMLAALSFAPVPLPAHAPEAISRQATRERPPAIGPPLSA